MEPVVNALKTAENWLDVRGRKAWIIAMVLAFIVAWPLGLLLLAYMIWSNKMAQFSRCSSRKWAQANHSRGSGNAAFDAYRDETLKRLEEEQMAFQGFLERLRRAKDQAEFDQFMQDRRNRPAQEMPDQDTQNRPSGTIPDSMPPMPA